jgi:hypothetical protein
MVLHPIIGVTRARRRNIIKNFFMLVKPSRWGRRAFGLGDHSMENHAAGRYRRTPCLDREFTGTPFIKAAPNWQVAVKSCHRERPGCSFSYTGNRGIREG